jgi:hypothetical protein
MWPSPGDSGDVSVSSSWRGCSHTSTKQISVAPLSLAPLVSTCPQPDTPTPTWPPATDATQMTPVTRHIHHRNHNAPKFLDMLGHASGLGTCGRQQADVHRTICVLVANVHKTLPAKLPAVTPPKPKTLSASALIQAHNMLTPEHYIASPHSVEVPTRQ